MGFADLDRSTLGCCQSPSTALRLWPSAIGRNDDRLGRDEISTPPSQRAGSSGDPGFAPRGFSDRRHRTSKPGSESKPLPLSNTDGTDQEQGIARREAERTQESVRTLQLRLAQALRCSPSGKAT
jgi:hypothetical protein